MNERAKTKVLFIINPYAGNNTTDWVTLIAAYFQPLHYHIETHRLKTHRNVESIKEEIKRFMPQQIVAVGGDGTIRLVAECLLGQNIPLGILPAGTANGLAKELGISTNPTLALDVIVRGHTTSIHVTKINKQLCIHLSDIGLNAFAMKNFRNMRKCGIWGYLNASISALWQSQTMHLEIKMDKRTVAIKAKMIVIANATKYGSGAIINPIGKLDDLFFEVIVVKKTSIMELYKMTFSHNYFDAAKTELFQTSSLLICARKKVHFQIDGEYLGKVNKIEAVLIPDAIELIVPNP